MHVLLLSLAAVTLALHALALLDAWRGNRRMRHLDALPGEGDPPSVSVVIAARDEEHRLEQALRSVLAQDHPRLEVIVVDDRSSDGTAQILRRMREQHPLLEVLRVDELPSGWLGKTHAQQRGAEAARGELLLFTDADVVFEPSAVRRAALYLAREGLDHLTVAPRVLAPTRAVEALVGAFTVLFCLWARPWRARDPRSGNYVGIGAFNLVRAAAWRAAGTHAAIRMRIDDDMMLGKILKREGRTQELLVGGEMVQVEWYPNARALVRGLTKNAFAGVDFSVIAVLLWTVLQITVHVWPWIGVVAGTGWLSALNAGSVALMGLYFVGTCRASGVRPWLLPTLPLGVLVLVYVQWRSMIAALWRGHVEWRGTRYPLSELRASRV